MDAPETIAQNEMLDAELARQLQFDFGDVTEALQPLATNIGTRRCVRCDSVLASSGSCEACGTYVVRCPYLDCGRVYDIPSWDMRCKVFRCGGCMYWGKFYQFPQHGSRDKVAEFLNSSEYRGQKWEGWPGSVHGCGRPFSFIADRLTFSAMNNGEKLTWSDGECPQDDPLLADPEGDYSPVVFTSPPEEHGFVSSHTREAERVHGGEQSH